MRPTYSNSSYYFLLAELIGVRNSFDLIYSALFEYKIDWEG